MPADFDSLINSLRERGHRITLPRRWTLRVLQEASGHITPEQVHKRLIEHDIRVDEATVYRTLQWLADNRIVTRTNFGQGADVFALVGDRPHHHLICLNCGHTIEIDDRLFMNLRERIRGEYGFLPQIDHYAIFGLCQSCLEQDRQPG